MTEILLYPRLIGALFAAAAVTWVVLTFIAAPYGRHVRAGWGPTMGARAGWIVMESPAVFAFAFFFALGRHRDEVAPLVLFTLWMAHYVHRSLVFPYRMHSAGKRMPVVIVLLGATFNLFNAYLHARWLSEFHRYRPEWLLSAPFLVGTTIFFVGLSINLHADTALLRLRAPGETGYRIPQAGLFRLVASPNYLGEIVEWIGWAVLTWSPAGVAFAVFTIANLAPRAGANRRWYTDTFPDYPRERRALIPFVW